MSFPSQLGGISEFLRTLADQFETDSLSPEQKEAVILFVTRFFADDLAVIAHEDDQPYTNRDLLRFFATGWYINNALKNSRRNPLA
jgi:hypothetical protein